VLEPTSAATDAERLRASVQTFVRRFGLLLASSTPCGKPMATSHAHALMVLLAAGRPLRQNELGEALCIDKSNVTRLCAQMQERGHVTQTHAPDDRRGRVVALTSQGARVGREVKQASEQRFELLLERIPRKRRRLVFAGISALNAALVDS
jgi:DNA-binding MarR family transcriptional regulator